MTNGSFYNYVQGTSENNYFGLYCEYTYSQNALNNYTDVTVDAYIRYYGLDISSVPDSVVITVNETSKTCTSPAIKQSGSGQKTKIGSATIRVYHENDGTKKNVNLNVVWNVGIEYNGVWYSSLTASTIVDLPAIPRASSVSLSSTGVYIEDSIVATITRANTAFTHTVEFYISDVYYQKFTNVSTSQSYTIPIDWCKAMPTAVSCAAYCRVTTYNDGVQIGDPIRKSFSVLIPGDIIPTIGSISLDPVDINGNNLLVKGKNALNISVADCQAGVGSNIKSYTFTGPSLENTTTTNTTITIPYVFTNGDLTYKVTITDSRGRTSSVTATITCYNYYVPSFNSFNAYRADSDGSANINGTYLKCVYSANYASVNDTNSTLVTLYYNNESQTISDGGALINLNGDTDTTYQAYLVIEDLYGGSNRSSAITVFGQSRIFNITSDGTGVAVGKMAEESSLFESRWPVKFDSNCDVNGRLTVGTSTQSTTPTTGITVHDVRNATITPDSFGDKNTNFYFDQINNRWMSILHMKGWAGSYAAWELAGNAHDSSNDITLLYRQGIGETWGDWQTVITNKNITNYVDQGSYLPLSGGTLTGKLTLDGSAYYASGDTAGLDCQNSDIINVNGIYFNDTSDAAGEAINFYRSDGYWDSLYTSGGVLRFHPNRGTSASFGGYRIYDTSYINFRRGTCTLTSYEATTVTFSSALAGTPTVMLTPLTTTGGVIPGKVNSVSSTGFVGIIGGSEVSSAKFAYLAIYY